MVARMGPERYIPDSKEQNLAESTLAATLTGLIPWMTQQDEKVFKHESSSPRLTLT